MSNDETGEIIEPDDTMEPDTTESGPLDGGDTDA